MYWDVNLLNHHHHDVITQQRLSTFKKSEVSFHRYLKICSILQLKQQRRITRYSAYQQNGGERYLPYKEGTQLIKHHRGKFTVLLRSAYAIVSPL